MIQRTASAIRRSPLREVLSADNNAASTAAIGAGDSRTALRLRESSRERSSIGVNRRSNRASAERTRWRRRAAEIQFPTSSMDQRAATAGDRQSVLPGNNAAGLATRLTGMLERPGPSWGSVPNVRPGTTRCGAGLAVVFQNPKSMNERPETGRRGDLAIANHLAIIAGNDSRSDAELAQMMVQVAIYQPSPGFS
jgi:hypothetical protein